ncbi:MULTISPECIES: DUF6163 family protein [Stappiaceae]|jgi:hypothetical protein|uniref:Uncharacterized protein n=2 Tax=Roseibium TaxID=150830 RepID=A0A0M6XWE7_9HYPH|nr:MULTISPECIES: DUF6163 family protein [Stappiaceae]MCR9282686.1 DUF6163 family protein [Paracoccaceae bacterium]MEC9419654.1 DUF6163 family protein [Pseudomonadota bacterium]AMN54008.1 hypothetical protein ACP90_18045 [Labrenzia sp. CP4]AQQ02488.1 hypothetical protein B0E33_01830 [Roseibium aggregatum]ERP85534.1 hypothetical protein Q669_17315 [Labrenzia sp. C1B10]
MITSFQDLIDSRPPWSTLLIWYLRGIAIILIGGGVIYWARIIGIVEWRGLWFWDMPVALQGAIVFFAVLDLVAATGLWLTVSWGTVMWIFRCFCQIVMHTAFSDLYGRRPYEIAFYLLTIAIYAGLAFLMDRENKANAG